MKRSRADRARSLVAKRPAITITIEATYEPCPAARETLLDLLVELLDECQRSGRR